MTTAPTVHLIYSHGSAISCPDAIGRNIARRLGERYPVVCYPLGHRGRLRPAPGDILLGHPDPEYWSVFRANLDDPRWSRRLAIIPFVHEDYTQCAFLDALLPRCDLLLGITGHYWASRLAGSRYAHWQAKFRHLDLAVDRADFPEVKTAFSPPGRRRFLYIGHRGWYKNLPYLARIAAACPGVDFGWIGNRKKWRIAGFTGHGYVDFTTPAARDLVASYDFLLVGSSADANPTVILEAMAWGLIPVCTPQCGYDNEPGIINIPLNDPAGAAAVLNALQQRPEESLRELQAVNRERLARHFTWDRFTGQVLEAVAGDASPPLGPETLANRLALRWHAATSPRSGLRWSGLRHAVANRLAW